MLNPVIKQNEAAALADTDAVFVVRIATSAQASFEFGSGQAVADTPITMGNVDFENGFFRGDVDGHDLAPAIGNKYEIADLEVIGGRGVDDVLTAHDTNPLGGLCAAHSSCDGGLARQFGFVFVDDVTLEDAKGFPEDWGDGCSPVSKVFDGIDYPSFSRDLVLCHLPSAKNFC